MVKWQHKIISILFSVLVLISSTGILLIHHHCSHCGAEDWHLFSAIHCETVTHNTECCSANSKINHDKEISEKSGCCKYEEFYFKVGTFISLVEINFSKYFNVIIDNVNSINIITVVDQSEKLNFYSDTSPPGIKENIYILYRSFRS